VPSVDIALQAKAEAERRKRVKPKSQTAPKLANIPDYALVKLDRLTKHTPTSRRLVERLMLANPNKTLAWCIDKAIWEIERDRR
jgi:hypothetical protein